MGLASKSARLRGNLAAVAVPIFLAATCLLASPVPALAASEFAETAVTTYRLDADNTRIDVTSLISITNNKKSTATLDYYWPGWYVTVPLQAGSVKATSNAGTVKQSVYKTTATTRVLLMTFPRLWYHETRVLTIAYSIPAGLTAAGGFRALKAFARLCAKGVGIDSGVLNVEIPDTFAVRFVSGSKLTATVATGGYISFSSGSVARATDFSTCLEAVDPAGLASTRIASTPSFEIQAWPEDPAWAAMVTAEAPDYAARLEALTGVRLPAGPIVLQEAGRSALGEYTNTPGPSPVEVIPDGASHAEVAHSLAHVLFNKSVFAQDWMAEGFASYSEKIAGAGNYVPCADPGVWPIAGYAQLDSWTPITIDSTADDRAVAAWQKAASCYLVTTLADSMGPDDFKAVVGAISRGEIAYAGPDPVETTAGLPVDGRALLDLIDERGLAPAGADPDEAQNLFALFGIVDSADLPARHAARAVYHNLAAAAGTWKLPYAVRIAMAEWDFTTATTAIGTANQIVALRDRTIAAVPTVSLDDSALRTAFEKAQTQSDLDAALDLAKKEAAAADLTAQAVGLNSANRSVFETVGLLGSDPAAQVGAATTALAAANPDDAGASAQQAIDMIQGSSSQGMIRLGVLVALLLALLFAILMLAMRQRQLAAPAEGAGPAAR